MNAEIARLFSDALDVVFPPECVHCGGLVEGGRLRHLCPACERQLKVVEEPHCTTCGHPFYGEMAGNRSCPHCETLVPVFGEGRTAILLKGPGRSLIHGLKYHEGLHLLDDVVRIMAETPGYADYVAGRVLVPVPLHARKLRERGYNQSLLLARCCVRACGGRAEVRELLRRTTDTESQTHYDREARRQNLKNAFALADPRDINPAQHYLLVDDVFTTGSTLNACAAVMRRGGCVNLDVVTFGHG